MDNPSYTGEPALQRPVGTEVFIETGDPLVEALDTVHGREGSSYLECWTNYVSAGKPEFYFDLTGGGDIAIGSTILWQYGNPGGTTDYRGGNGTAEFVLIFHTEAEGSTFNFTAEPVEFYGVMDSIYSMYTAGNYAQFFSFGTPVTARYVGLRVLSNPRMVDPLLIAGGDRYGLGEVRFATEIGMTTTEVISPGNEAVDVPLDTNLIWAPPQDYTPARQVLYFREGDSNWLDTANTIVVDSVVDIPEIPTDDPNTTVAAVPVILENLKTYYWRVDAYEPSEVPILHAGDTWSFTTADKIPEETGCRGLLAGDLNVDCSVNLEDLQTIMLQWLADVDCVDETCGDLDENDRVDLADVAKFSENWQKKVTVLISEFLASNDDNSGLADEDGSLSDWIELHNYSSSPVNLNGWYLTDDDDNLDKWRLPDVTIEANGYLIVFASGKDRADPNSPLHTNFYLGTGGEYLALIKEDGQTIVHEYPRQFPVQYEDVSYGLAIRPDERAISNNYFFRPTPGTANGTPYPNVGPAISGVQHRPARPGDTDDLVVTAAIAQTQKPIASVQLKYRVMYDSEVTLSMFDDGTHGDGAAGDGVYGATIPASAATPGQMIRYYIETTDTYGGENRLPLPLDMEGDNQSPEYFGTVVANPAVTSDLPIIEWFTQDYSNSHTRTGAHASVYYLGEFYDNIFVRQRGQATNGYSQKFDFNKAHDFFAGDTLGRVGEINLNAQGSDPAYIRQTLAFETHANIGVPSCESFMILMQVNGNFDRVGVFVEQVDEDFLKRNNLDPEGALYKFIQRSAETTETAQEKYWDSLPHTPVFSDTDNPGDFGTGSIEKKTRRWEDFSDLQAVVDALTHDDEDVYRRFIFDRFNLPEMMDYLAAKCVTRDTDDTRKNFYFYCDTNGSGEWMIFPWDKDWTFANTTGEGDHPFFGDKAHWKAATKQWNVLYDVVFNMPETQEMFLRRLRTVMDTMLQPLGTPTEELIFEARVDELAGPVMDHLDISSAVNILKGYFTTRRNYLFNVEGPSGTGLIPESLEGSTEFVVTDTLISGVPGVTTAEYHVPTDDSLGLTWTENGFNGSWATGYTGIGYERSTGDAVNYTDQIYTDVNSQMAGRTSFYARVPFMVSDPAAYDSLVLSMKYDDGFVAYINGVEVARRYFTGDPVWNSNAGGGKTDSECKIFEEIIISASTLTTGENVLAIHGLNRSSTSSDLLILPELKGAVNIIVNPVVSNVDIANVEFNPVSGIQDQEYIQIVNHSATAIDLSGWHLSNAVEFTFKPGTVIITGGSLYVSPSVRAFRERTTSPKGNEGRFVVGPYSGHLSNWGETIYLTDTNQTLIDTFTYQPAPSDPQRYLRITELMYHPAQGGTYNEEEYEYIELKNIAATSLLLDGVKFGSGIAYAFDSGVSIPAGQYRLLVKNQAAFESRYAGLSDKIIGQYTGSSLDNGGERLDLLDATNSTILDFSYKDGWFSSTDGEGFSLTVIDPTVSDLTIWDDKSGWRPSASVGGSPGTDDAGQIPLPGSVVVNELLAHSDTDLYDWVELYNTTSEPINIGGWFLSDSNTDDPNRMKFEIPADTIIAGNGYVVFDENLHFGNPSHPGCHQPFQFSENGETVYLRSGQSGGLTGYFEEEDFGASEKDVAFGRFEKSTGTFNFVAMSVNTPGLPNAYPKVGPVVITEIMYHPQANADAEYVELMNISGSAVTLYDVTTSEPWRFVDDADDPGLEFLFPSTPVTLAAGRRILLIKDAAAFEAEYGAGSLNGITYYEWIDGSLSNGDEKPELLMPGDVNTSGQRQYIRVDRVSYEDSAPWPTAPDGTGQSLQKPEAKLSLYSNDVENWQAALPTPGM